MYSDDIRATTALVTEIAPLLPGWSVDTAHDYDVPALNGPDGLYIMIRTDYSKSHYTISGNVWGEGNLYNHLTYQERNGNYKLSINVAQSKTAKQIAADITRRLLPLLEPINARRIESETKQAAACEQRTALLARLEQALGSTPGVRHHTSNDGMADFSCSLKKGTGSYPRLEVTTNYQGTAVKVVLDDISPDMAAAILALVATATASA